MPMAVVSEVLQPLLSAGELAIMCLTLLNLGSSDLRSQATLGQGLARHT